MPCVVRAVRARSRNVCKSLSTAMIRTLPNRAPAEHSARVHPTNERQKGASLRVVQFNECDFSSWHSTDSIDADPSAESNSDDASDDYRQTRRKRCVVLHSRLILIDSHAQRTSKRKVAAPSRRKNKINLSSEEDEDSDDSISVSRKGRVCNKVNYTEQASDAGENTGE